MPDGCVLRLLFGIVVAASTFACAPPSRSTLEVLHQSTVLVEHPGGHGSGAILGPNAILTADHVVTDEPLKVTFFDGQAALGHVRWRNPALDLAVVEVAVPNSYPMPEWFCGDLLPGQHLVLIGHPTHSRWVAVGGHLPSAAPYEGDLVALGFPIALGTSGGPVFDENGRAVGVALAILAEFSSASANFGDLKDTGIGLMLPAKSFCERVGLG